MSLAQRLFGRPLSTEEEQHERIGAAQGVPVLGLDALASASYGPEAALTVLLPAGAAVSAYLLPISGCILLVLLLVFFSYWQTIAAYPGGGGSFTVASQNLGPLAGLFAASALSVDYVLNTAVAISAGVGAIVSAAPLLLPYTLPLALALLAGMTIINLRGVRATGLVFMAPTYVFITTLGLTIVIGAIHTIASGGHPQPLVPLHPPATGSATGNGGGATAAAVTTWLLLRAFSSGCTALTGVEAVSNGVPLFREPNVAVARRTLAIIVGVLAFLLIGIGFLARAYGITATAPGQPGYESLISQITSSIVGRGWFYYVTMASVLAVLAMSANTSFADFPRVCRVLAQDHYLPPELTRRGSRLVYSNGIIVLSVMAAGLLILFDGVTDRLIPLFAVGAFLAFTMSQAGMAAHWRRSHERGRHHKLLLNALGASATGICTVIIVIAKFREGAWMTVLVIPCFVWLFISVRRYQDRLAAITSADGPLDVTGLTPPIVVLPLRRLDRVGRKALRFSLTISPDVYVVQVQAEELDTEDLQQRWRHWIEDPLREVRHPPPQLVLLPSPYRDFYTRLLGWLQNLTNAQEDRHVLVVIPELVHRHWYQFLINHRATRLKTLLLLEGGPRVAVMNTPWYPDASPFGTDRGAQAPDATADRERRSESALTCASTGSHSP